jgi:hypothetical protein
MLSGFSLRACLLGLLFGGTATMDGQEQLNQTPYDSQALRLETRWGEEFLLRGREGTVVGKIGGLRGGLDLAAVVAPSPDAMREAAVFKNNYPRGVWSMTVGLSVVAVGAAVARVDDIGTAADLSAMAAGIGGTFLAAYGYKHLQRARSALSRSIWWYNRDLVR